MKQSIHIAIIGDYDPLRPRHLATEAALEHAAVSIGLKIKKTWVSTSQINAESAHVLLDCFDAYFGAPGEAVSLEGALQGIRYARESFKPYLGTCAGFGHAVLEFARSVVGIQNATSAEWDSHSPQLVLTQLSCLVAGKKMKVKVKTGTLAHKLYGTSEIVEEHHCHYGIDSKYRSLLNHVGLRISATDMNDEPRIVELPSRVFYLATLFVPQTSSTPTNPHPLFVGYLEAAI